MRWWAVLAWLAGAALLAALVATNNARDVMGAVAALGWWIAAIVAFHAVPLVLDTLAWRALFAEPPAFARLLAIRWMGESANGLFPVPHLGELLRADLARRASPTGEAGASVVVDVTLGIGTEVPFIALGLVLYGLRPDAAGLLRTLLPALLVIILFVIELAVLQRAGLFGLAAKAGKHLPGRLRRSLDLRSAHALDGRIGATYGRRAQLLGSAFWRLAGWIAGAGEIWLALYALGHPVGAADALILESLSQAARTAAFAIPGGLGIQDGALLLICGQLGIGADTALALALVKRCREAALGLPGLAAAYVAAWRHRQTA